MLYQVGKAASELANILANGNFQEKQQTNKQKRTRKGPFRTIKRASYYIVFAAS